mgnify:FL=1|tara:strand:- start:68 stop:1261 length:1194 start_codon:yes stop_codon:yes gene_type:complete
MEQLIIVFATGAFIGFFIHKLVFSRKTQSLETNKNLENENIDLKKQVESDKLEINDLKTKIEVKNKEIELTAKNTSEKLEFKNEMIKAVGDSVSETTKKEQKPYIEELVAKEQRVKDELDNLKKQKAENELKEKEILRMHAEANIKKEYSSSARGLDCQQVMERIIMSSGYERGKSVYFDKKQDGIKGRPDATLIYPLGRKICCDAKAPLAKFDEIIDAGQKGDAERIEKLKSEFGKKIIDHVTWLAGKEYERTKNSEDYILMFLPSAVHEQMARECTQLHQKDLDEYAHSKKIYVVSPGTFTPYVQNAYACWQMHENTESAEETLKIVKTAFDAARILAEKIVTTKNKIGTAYKGAEDLEKSYNSTFKKATEKVSESGYSDENVIKIKEVIDKQEG